MPHVNAPGGLHPGLLNGFRSRRIFCLPYRAIMLALEVTQSAVVHPALHNELKGPRGTYRRASECRQEPIAFLTYNDKENALLHEAMFEFAISDAAITNTEVCGSCVHPATSKCERVKSERVQRTHGADEVADGHRHESLTVRAHTKKHDRNGLPYVMRISHFIESGPK